MLESFDCSINKSLANMIMPSSKFSKPPLPRSRTKMSHNDSILSLLGEMDSPKRSQGSDFTPQGSLMTAKFSVPNVGKQRSSMSRFMNTSTATNKINTEMLTAMTHMNGNQFKTESVQIDVT